MKLAILIMTMIPAMGWAKVSNFNDLIQENAKAQQELHQNLEGKKVSREGTDRAVVVETRTYNAPTGQNALRFSKELNHQRPSNKKELDRLANEFRAADQEF